MHPLKTTHILTHTNTHTHIHTDTQTHTHSHTNIHTYTQRHTHTQIHTHTHSHTLQMSIFPLWFAIQFHIFLWHNAVLWLLGLGVWVVPVQKVR